MGRRVGLILVCLVGCGGGGGMDDAGGGMDVPSPIDVPMAFDVDVGESCEDVAEGTTTCTGGFGRSCCDGHWMSFADGPCWPSVDGGPPEDGGGVDAGTVCDRDPGAAGCPCETEGEIACPFIQFRRVCRDGEWAVDVGFVCC